MWQLRIRDTGLNGALAFDLRDVLRALGSDALKWMWVVSGVGGEAVLATGPGADQLDAFERSGAAVSGASLLATAERTQQVISGDFRAYRVDRHEDPWVTVIAFDSSWYDVFCEDEAILANVASAFAVTTLTAPHHS